MQTNLRKTYDRLVRKHRKPSLFLTFGFDDFGIPCFTIFLCRQTLRLFAFGFSELGLLRLACLLRGTECCDAVCGKLIVEGVACPVLPPEGLQYGDAVGCLHEPPRPLGLTLRGGY